LSGTYDMTVPAELATEQGFVEGPVWLGGGRVAFVGGGPGRLSDLDLEGGRVDVLAELGGKPNGLASQSAGTLWVCQAGPRDAEVPAPSIQRLSQGSVSTAYEGGLMAPNDCAFGPDGRLWFTDPSGTLSDPRVGRVWALDAQTGRAALMTSADDYPNGFFPNGLAFGPDATELFVADTRNDVVLRYRIEDGSLSPPELFGQVEGGRPDGMAFDSAGFLWVASLGGESLLVISPDGDPAATWSLTGCLPTNLCFAGDGLDVLVVTEMKAGRVLAFDSPVPGLKLL
jgi:gluconolactonase